MTGSSSEQNRFPGYDVLAKRDTPSWNEQTRRVIEQRLSLPDEPRFFTEQEWRTLRALCERVLPQPVNRAHPVPLAAMVDHQMVRDRGDGFRKRGMPPLRDAWRRGLAAIEAEARLTEGASFDALPTEGRDALLHRVQKGEVKADAWQGLPAKDFFHTRVIHDIVGAYYAHPVAWTEIGFGGPASPRGYVRLGFNRRDPWEAAERKS